VARRSHDAIEAAKANERILMAAISGISASRPAEGAQSLLGPPQGSKARGVARALASLGKGAQLAASAGGASDALYAVARSDPQFAQLASAIEREQRMGRLLEMLRVMQGRVTAGMAAIVTG